jgi:dolichol-phosphate mannosyltransferase
MSNVATSIGRAVLRTPVSDPMSGFFMLHRRVLDASVRDLSGLGFKILLDLLTSCRMPLRIVEVPYRFRTRMAGESKFDGMVVWEYGMLLADKTIGRYVPVRFVMFSIIGGLGVFVHMAVLTTFFTIFEWSFVIAQSGASAVTMVFNFWLNNILTYRDRRLKGWRWFRGLVTFMLVCSVGAIANVGVASYLFNNRIQWISAALVGVLLGAVWNYAVTQLYTWGRHR